jgi:hypothetical protein
MGRNNTGTNLDVVINSTGGTIGAGSTVERKLTWAGANDFTLSQTGTGTTTYALNSPNAADHVVISGDYGTAGALLYGTTNAANAPGNLALGTVGQILQAGASAPQWVTASFGTTWTTFSATVASTTAQNGYILTGSPTGAISIPLPPLSATIGQTFSVYSMVAGGTATFKLTQIAAQQVQFGAYATTSGTSGYLQNSAIGDGVTLICVSSGIWLVISAVGNISVN